MFQTIQARSNYRIDKIGPNGVIGANRSCDGTVDLLLKNGSFFKAPFGGFLPTTNIIGLRRVKIMFIRALCLDSEAEYIGYTIPNHHYVVGTYLEGKAYTLLYDGKAEHELVKGADIDTSNNVVSLL
ncbi:hypothetical protein [Vibrio sp. Isolate24]|uniref:hypothetical protein n=1 Tax=Vibrio sp. Isolate24 TaxID=2908534 RepID=UPI001EFD7442|nr:hypothetical protein [Vibrio sp. Isolate24]MCG9678713.1 hypothetical protein [Vibrio sp. Isolate24]